MPKRPRRSAKARPRRSAKRRSTAASTKNSRAIKAISRKPTRTDFTKGRVQLQHGRLSRIPIDPKSLRNLVVPGAATPAWRWIFGQQTAQAALREKDDVYISGLDLMQHFNTKTLLKPGTQNISESGRHPQLRRLSQARLRRRLEGQRALLIRRGRC